jgi:hypothetical protein
MRRSDAGFSFFFSPLLGLPDAGIEHRGFWRRQDTNEDS